MAAAQRGLYAEYVQLAQPHVASFDYFVREGLQRTVRNVKPVEVQHPKTERIYRLSLSNPSLSRPSNPNGGRLYPRECRQMRLSYSAPLLVDLSVNDMRRSIQLGQMPIMVQSILCNVRGMSKAELYRRGEEANDFGGYFVVGGLEKILRMLFTQRRHYIMALDRPQFTRNGPLFTSKATVIRCVREDEVGSVMRCHQLRDDSVCVGIMVENNRFFLPAGVLLRALSEANDHELYDHLAAASPAGSDVSHSAFVALQAEQCICQLAKYGLKTQHEAIEFLGRYYRAPMGSPPRMTDYDVGMDLLSEHVFTHLPYLQQKFHLLIQMMHKLYAFCNSQCQADNPDSLATQEVVLPGFILMKVTHDIMRQYLRTLRNLILKTWNKAKDATDLERPEDLQKLLGSAALNNIAQKVEHMLRTGRYHSMSLRDLGQDSGLAMIPDRINFFRYLSHYRSIHKGAVFTQMKTTQPRKLLPDAWGFVCPVHTPDGPPCGLLLHLTSGCRVAIGTPANYDSLYLCICKVLAKYGMVSVTANVHPPPLSSYLRVVVDGRVAGHVGRSLIDRLVKRLRWVKAVNYARQMGEEMEIDGLGQLDAEEKQIPGDTEVAYVPVEKGGMFPGLWLYTMGGRMLREVRQLHSGMTELIGPLEQQHLMIKVPGDAEKRPKLQFSHEEVHSKNLLSILALLTPFSEFNQSPRNMYQCQMAKQTMGTPCLDFQFRPENKLYRLQTPQSPICRTQTYEAYHLDEYPSGTNAVVAVIATTGYDMEDAMILNKASVDRGFAHGSIYKTEQFFLTEERIDEDGLPFPGAVIHPEQPYSSVRNHETDTYKSLTLKDKEPAIVDQVSIIGNNRDVLCSANIRFRINRNPVIGDKFASRAGQKGILSRQWMDTDFPFCATTGMRPDLIINPHAFPSRMTIGMLVESIASKSCSDDPSSPDKLQVFGEMLEKAGFSAQGKETVINGMTGEEMECDIYIGLVYYQRLRHMVYDKYQCRALGPVNAMTRQPVKGRKAKGGIRFGEMERDAAITHGVSYILNDRLGRSSDWSYVAMCQKCGSMLSPAVEPYLMPEAEKRMLRTARTSDSAPEGRWTCAACDGDGSGIQQLGIPYVSRLLIAELAVANIRIVFGTTHLST